MISEGELVTKLNNCKRLLCAGPLAPPTAHALAKEMIEVLVELHSRGYQVREAKGGLTCGPLDLILMEDGSAVDSHQMRERVFFYLYRQEMSHVEIGHVKPARKYQAAMVFLIKLWEVSHISHVKQKLRFKNETI
jgi:hypothetical protein